MKKYLILTFVMMAVGIFMFSTAQGPVLRVRMWDTNSSHYAEHVFNEDDSSNRQVLWLLNSGNRTIDLSENFTIGGGSDVTITAEDAAGAITLDNISFEVEDEVGSGNTIKIVNATSDASRTITLSEDFTISDGQNVTLHGSGGEGAQLAIDTQNAERTLDMSANLTVTGASTINQNVSTTGDPTFDDLVIDKLEVNESFTFDSFQTATGDGDTTIDWGLGNNMYFTFGAQNEIIRFTAPPGSAIVRMIIKQDGVGSRTIDWSNIANILWPGNVEPTLTTGAATVDIIVWVYDGTSWHGLFNGDFR